MVAYTKFTIPAHVSTYWDIYTYIHLYGSCYMHVHYPLEMWYMYMYM